MSIQEIVLQPSNRPPVAFQGRIVAHAAGPAEDPALLDRHHEITVYETVAGELHLVIEFKTGCKHDTPHCEVELGLLADEIADILLVYDATESVNREKLAHQPERATMQFLKRLHNQYDDLCASIGQQMLRYQPAAEAGMSQDPKTSESQRSGWRSWIRFRH